MHASMQRLYDLSGLKGSALARKMNASQQSINNWQIRGLSKDAAIKASKIFGSSVEWLLEGTGQPPANGVQKNVEPITARMLPILSWVQAGNMTRTEPISQLDITDWHPEIGNCGGPSCFFLRVTGISNHPVYQEGDLIMVNPTIQPDKLQSGDMVVVRVDDDATFKRLVIEPSGQRYLQALNPHWTPNIIPFMEDMQLVGQVVDAVRPIGVPKRNH